MSNYTTTMNCTNCGGAIHPSHEKCRYCESPIFIKENRVIDLDEDNDFLEVRYIAEAGLQFLTPSKNLFLKG